MPATVKPLLPEVPLLSEWFAGEAGQSLLADQREALQRLVPDQFYQVGLQYGLCDQSFLRQLNVEQTLYCDMGRRQSTPTDRLVIARPDALPLPEHSVDLALLLHTLDYCEEPHAVLREIAQVLSPEGVLLVSGFHPYSLWGLERRLNPRQAPFDARFVSRGAVQDWMALLGFQPLTGCMLNYQLPQLSSNWRRRLGWMNQMGDRWWPGLGAVYLLVFRKKVYGGLGVRQATRRDKKWFPGLEPASARLSHKGSLAR